MITDYDIISSRSKEKLIALTKAAMEDGWQPSGGHIHVVYEEPDIVNYTQGMIVPEDWSPEEGYRITGCWSQSMIKEVSDV